MTANNDNGNGHGSDARKPATVSITMDLPTHTVAVKLETPNLDCALSMLAAATRAVEVQLRQQQALAFASRVQQAEQDKQIAEMIRGGRA